MSLTDEQLIEMLTRGRNAAEVLLARMERYRAHSVTLNAVAFKLAEALGDVPHGQTWTEGDPVELADRLIAERDRLRGDAADAVQMLADLTSVGEQPEDGAQPQFLRASPVTVGHAGLEGMAARLGIGPEVPRGGGQQCANVHAHGDHAWEGGEPLGIWWCVGVEQLVAYDLLVQARGDAVDAVQMLADLTEPGEPISGVAPPPVQFGVRCADPSHPEGEHREVYSVTYVAHRLQPMANSIPCYELVFSRDGGRTWSEADGGSGS